MCQEPGNESSEGDYRKNIVDLMTESQEYRSLIFHIASIPSEDRGKLQTPPMLQKSWKTLTEGNNADYAVLNYYTRKGILKA